MVNTLAEMSFAEFHAAQEEIRYKRQVKRVRELTMEINRALAERNYGRVALLADQLNDYCLSGPLCTVSTLWPLTATETRRTPLAD